VYGLFTGMTGTGDRTSKHSTERLGQAHVELAQAMALQIPKDKLAVYHPCPASTIFPCDDN